MTEEKCRKFINSDLQNVIMLCESTLEEMDSIDLNDIDWQLGRILQRLENAKKRLNNCEDF